MRIIVHSPWLDLTRLDGVFRTLKNATVTVEIVSNTSWDMIDPRFRNLLKCCMVATILSQHLTLDYSAPAPTVKKKNRWMDIKY